MSEPTYRDAETLARVYYESAGWEWDELDPSDHIANARSFIAVAYHVAERITQARLDGRCASCGEPATTTSRPNGRLTLVCLRHYNVWQTPPDPQRIRETWADAILACGWVTDLREAEDAGAERPITTPPPCNDHREVQHRDGKPPWCNACGWRHGRPAQPPVQLRIVNDAP